MDISIKPVDFRLPGCNFLLIYNETLCVISNNETYANLLLIDTVSYQEIGNISIPVSYDITKMDDNLVIRHQKAGITIIDAHDYHAVEFDDEVSFRQPILFNGIWIAQVSLPNHYDCKFAFYDFETKNLYFKDIPYRVHQGIIYRNKKVEGRNYIERYDEKTQHRLWEFELSQFDKIVRNQERPGHCLIFERVDNIILADTLNGTIIALDVNTGQLIWHIDTESDPVLSAYPATKEGRYVKISDGLSHGYLHISPDGKKLMSLIGCYYVEINVYSGIVSKVVDKTNEWAPKNYFVYQGFAVENNYFYFYSHHGVGIFDTETLDISAYYDAEETMKPLRTEFMKNQGGPVYHDKKIYIVNSEQELQFFEIEDLLVQTIE